MGALFSSPQAREAFLQTCRAALREAERVAFTGMRDMKTPQGGPFGAALAVFLEDGNLGYLAGPCVNRVLETGLASCHAEHESLSPPLYEKLVRAIEALPNAAGVVLLSSAQPCVTCHTKMEIAARDLIRRGLIEPGRFLCVYGARYEETLRVAGFNDIAYADALILAAEKGAATKRIALDEAPDEIRAFFEKTGGGAAILSEGRLYASGSEGRGPYDPFSTAEVKALRESCRRARSEGRTDSWNAKGTLYTANEEIGPLLFSETLWTGVRDIVSVRGLAQARETPELSNEAFLRIVASGYGDAQRAVSFFWDSSHENLSQQAWSKLLRDNNELLYNGAPETEAAPSLRALTESRFAAPELSALA